MLDKIEEEEDNNTVNTAMKADDTNTSCENIVIEKEEDNNGKIQEIVETQKEQQE